MGAECHLLSLACQLGSRLRSRRSPAQKARPHPGLGAQMQRDLLSPLLTLLAEKLWAPPAYFLDHWAPAGSQQPQGTSKSPCGFIDGFESLFLVGCGEGSGGGQGSQPEWRARWVSLQWPHLPAATAWNASPRVPQGESHLHLDNEEAETPRG